MALAGAPRLILFDEPAAGLSPAERRELVALLASLPLHMSYLLIEHDLEIAMRAATRVTVMHNGRVLKERHARRDRERRPGAGDLHGRGGVDAPTLTSFAAPRGGATGLGNGPAAGQLMAWGSMTTKRKTEPTRRCCRIEGLDVHYGRAHVLQGVELDARARRTWRSSAGTAWARRRSATPSPAWCRRAAASSCSARKSAAWRRTAITPARHRLRAAGAARLAFAEASTRTLRLALVAPKKEWTSSASTTMFPRLAERKSHGGAQLSGGEAPVLAIGRALLLEPKLLVMDEPTEGLAPMIVEQVVEALRGLAAESEIAVLLIEQNLGVAIDVADRVDGNGQRPDRPRARRPAS